MKKTISLDICLVLLFLAGTLQAQINQEYPPILPIKPFGIPMFGEDIVINDQPIQNQQRVALCRAFNGWLFAAVTYKDPSQGIRAMATVLKSKDNGLTWNTVLDGWYSGGGIETVFSSVDILAIGDSDSNLKIIMALVAQNSSTGIGYGFVNGYNSETGIWEWNLCNVASCYDIAIASDYTFPATNSNPHSLGILYSSYSMNGDSLIFLSSSNGGLAMDNRKVVASSSSRFHKVALNYGRSPSWSSGSYFAAWEEQDDFGYMPGRIFTAHSEPNFNSPFTTPVKLDALDPLNDNMCSNPAIACQYSNVDNDSSNFTEVVMFDRYNQSANRYDVKGYYNLQATNHSYFRPFSVSDATHNNYQPDVNFNPYDSTFMVTYVDSTSQKLPFLTNNFNFQNPNQWRTISPGYNDSSNLTSSYPKVEVTPGLPNGANVWIGQRNADKGMALFDSPSHTWPGVTEIKYSDRVTPILYPNPSKNKIYIAFELEQAQNVTIKLYSIIGQSLDLITNQNYTVGKHLISYDISSLPDGGYLYSFISGAYASSGKFAVIK